MKTPNGSRSLGFFIACFQKQGRRIAVHYSTLRHLAEITRQFLVVCPCCDVWSWRENYTDC